MIQDCTKKEGEAYSDFVRRAGQKPGSRAIKISDLQNNMKIERLQVLDDKAVARLKKYHEAYRYLTSLAE